LKVCLFGDESYSLRDAIRAGDSEELLMQGIGRALSKKKAVLGGHGDVLKVAGAVNSNRPMILIGG
jgi:molybdenum cofactor biosynthesis enzyme MoaA